MSSPRDRPARGARACSHTAWVSFSSSLFSLHPLQPPPLRPAPEFPLKYQPHNCRGSPQPQPSGAALSSGLRGPGRACIVPFLEFFKSESSLAVNGALFAEAGPAKGRGPAIVRLECAGMPARVARPQSGAFVCKHQQTGPPINNDDLTARAGQASGYQDSIL